MNIVILGAGSIGSLFGGLLSVNNDVTMICRPEHAKAIAEDGLTITGKTDLVVKPKALDSVYDLQAPDILFITVKSYDTGQAAEDVKAIVGDETIVVSLQNGLGNLETISEEFPGIQVIGITTSHGARIISPGVVEHAGLGSTVVGGYKNEKTQAERVAELLNRAGIETSVTENIEKEIWSKALVNAAINPLATILRQENGALLAHDGLQDIMQAIIREGVRVANSQGAGLSEEQVFTRTLDVIVQTAGNRCSMLQDVEKGKRTEIDQISGAIVDTGARNGVKTPVNQMMGTLIRAIQNGACFVSRK